MSSQIQGPHIEKESEGWMVWKPKWRLEDCRRQLEDRLTGGALQTAPDRKRVSSRERMVVVVFFATLLPSRRAAGIIPIEALRDD
jgi:uncharacterized protein (UPF0248 family)